MIFLPITTNMQTELSCDGLFQESDVHRLSEMDDVNILDEEIWNLDRVANLPLANQRSPISIETSNSNLSEGGTFEFNGYEKNQ